MMIRAISAVVAVLLLIVVSHFAGTRGLEYLCVFIALSAIDEYARLAFARTAWPRHLRFAFIVFASLIFGATWLDIGWSSFALSIAATVFIAMALLTIRTVEDLTPVIGLIGTASIGFIYCGLFTGFATRLLSLEQGMIWFFGLAAIVFSGDTFAYFFGRFFGNAKLLEAVSPKKTIVGALGGLLGSCIAGVILAVFFLPDRPVFAILFMSITVGAFAQLGDLFESLLKRVADVKDSGWIMPGHGGVLDRIDGLLFAAPVYYVMARMLVA